MTDLTDSDYETLLVHLGEQLTASMRRAGWNEEEASKCASDTLANSWQAELTANGWLRAAGAHLGVDTSDCVGA
jgi:hypothetical protein